MGDLKSKTVEMKEQIITMELRKHSRNRVKGLQLTLRNSVIRIGKEDLES